MVGDSGSKAGGFPFVTVSLSIVGAIAFVAIVVALTVGVGQVSSEGPDVDVGFEFDADVSPTTADSFGNTGHGHDGLLRIRLIEGHVAEARDLVVVGAASEPVRATFAPEADFAPERPVEAGTTVSIWVDRDDTVELRWQPPESGQDISLARWE